MKEFRDKSKKPNFSSFAERKTLLLQFNIIKQIQEKETKLEH